jgi:hypothetical protein
MDTHAMTSRGLAVILLVLSACALSAEEQSQTTVGVPQRIEDVVLPGPRLEVRPLPRQKAEIVVRILQDYRHGTEWRYDLEYFGQQSGTFDLVSFLQPRDGAKPVSLAAVQVVIGSSLPPGQVEPHPLEPASLPQLGGYRRMISLAVVGWVFGLLGIVAWMVRHRLRTLRQDVEHIEAGRSVVERLRPLLEYAREGAISNRQQAELERLILSFWRQRLGLEGVSAIEAMSMLRSHEEAGQLLVKLEHWLHRPDTSERESIDSLLRPYEEMLSSSK